MKKSNLEAVGFLRGASAVILGLLTILGMLYTDSFEALISVLLIGSVLIVTADNYLSK